MSIDGKLLVKAKAALKEKRRMFDKQYANNLQRIYAKSPVIQAIDEEIKETMSELFAVALTPGSESQIEDIRLKNLELQDERRAELIKAGFPPSSGNEEYMCPKCKDTGYIYSDICDCLLALYKEEQRTSLSNLFKLGNETFDNFDMTLYDDTLAPDTGISPRRAMEIIYEICVEYARKFNDKSLNLFFNGAPGLGKTFLSACIAKVVSENGYSVVYDTASSLFSKFEDVKFGRADEQREVRDEALAEVKRCLECDLLILDDLGTEMTTSFTISALYDIINTRLISGKKTIVSSNLTIAELRFRYSEQIMSRLEGEYQVLTFRGDDIRKKKNAL